MQFLIFFTVGILAQFIDGSIGMGYGVSSSRLLISFGIYPAIASASVHTAEIFTTLASGGFHLKFGNVQRHMAVSLIIPGILGAILGAYLCVKISTGPIKIIVNSILLLMGIIILYQFTFKNFIKLELRRPSLRMLLPLGFFAAFIDTLGGGGWGPIATTTLVVNNTEPRKAIGSVNFAEFFITVAGVITFLTFLGWEKFEWKIVLALMLGGLISAPLGALFCKKLSPKLLGILVGIGVILLSIFSLIQK